MPHCLARAETADGHAVFNYVGNHIDFRISIHEATAALLDRSPVEIAEAPAECDEILVGELLSAKQQDQAIEPCRVDGAKIRSVDALQVHAPDFRSQGSASRTDRHHETLYQAAWKRRPGKQVSPESVAGPGLTVTRRRRGF